MILGILPACTAFGVAQESQNQKLDRQYQEAVATYEAGRYAEAAAQLEVLLPHAPDSFAIHEMLGLSYAALSQDKKPSGIWKQRSDCSRIRLRPGRAWRRF